MGIFNNIGNFGKKVSEYNKMKSEARFEKLKAKAADAEIAEKKLKEELRLREKIDKANAAKRKLQEKKLKPYKDAFKKLEKGFDKFEKNRKAAAKKKPAKKQERYLEFKL